MKPVYILDGKKVKERDITFSHLKRGFLYGDGVFETLLAKDNRIFMWDEHIKRLKKGADLCGLDITYDIERIKKGVEEYLGEKKLKDAYIRINLWREIPENFDPGMEKKTHILVLIREYHPYPERFYKKGIRCIVSRKCFKNEKSHLVSIKSLNYLENIIARIEAKRNRCDDVVLLNTSGYIASGTVSNLFFVKKDVIYTPSIDCGILPGITRGLVLEICKKNRIKLKEGRFILRDLKGAEEVFFTNTLMGVLPVIEIKGIFKSKEFSVSRFLREEVDRRIKG